jgi:ferredoxin
VIPEDDEELAITATNHSLMFAVAKSRYDVEGSGLNGCENCTRACLFN